MILKGLDLKWIEKSVFSLLLIVKWLVRVVIKYYSRSFFRAPQIAPTDAALSSDKLNESSHKVIEVPNCSDKFTHMNFEIVNPAECPSTPTQRNLLY